MSQSPSDPGCDERDLFVLHSSAPDDIAFVRSQLLPEMGLPDARQCCSGDLEPGEPKLEFLERKVCGSRVVVVVLSPTFLNEHWPIIGEALASYHATQGGWVVPLKLFDCAVPLRLAFRDALDCRDPERRGDELERLRQLLRQPAPVEQCWKTSWDRHSLDQWRAALARGPYQLLDGEVVPR
ncbi:MAG: TIR domain-containing protein [Myxococcales bacterium]|nr:TIR domain-containing protein [Myxococcales bacterium]HRC54313.1 TIR domain-containing protein [Kofleriaceae bacterium]